MSADRQTASRQERGGGQGGGGGGGIIEGEGVGVNGPEMLFSIILRTK